MEKNRPNRDQVPLSASCQGKILLDNRLRMHNAEGGEKTCPSKARSYRSCTRGGNRNLHSRAHAPRQPSVISSTSTSSYLTTTATSVHITVALWILLVACLVGPTLQQDGFYLCPKVCKCDLQMREVICNGSLGASSLPHILDPGTKRMVFNNTQISQTGHLTSYQSLVILDLAFNRLTLLDLSSITSSLESLNASHNTIVELRDSALSSVISKLGEDEQRPFVNIDTKNEPDEFKKYRKSKINVMELDLSHNQIITIRNYLFMRWHKLQRLDLSYNSIDVLPSESLIGLTKLEHLNLRGNRLSAVDGSVFQATTKWSSYSGSADGFMSMLKTLDMSENPLRSLAHSSFAALGQTHTLWLDACSLQTIEDQAFVGLSSLRTLSLANNDLEDVPSEALNALATIKSLDMSSNRIQTIRPYAFKNLYYLEELHLSSDSLRELQPEACNGLGSLWKLDLSHSSNLRRIDSSLFDNIPKLSYLNLFACPLTSLHAPDTITSHVSTIIDLRSNSLTCDCDLKWLTSQMKKFNETAQLAYRNKANAPHLDSQLWGIILNQTLLNEILNITCARPPALVGKPVIGLPENKLECIRPSSPLNVQIGFASLFFMVVALTTVCMINFYHNEKHLIGKLKENIVQNRISMMSPYVQDMSKGVDGATRETQLDCADYEPVDFGPIYTVPGDPYMTAPPQQQHTLHL